MKVIPPVALLDANLTSSSIAEPDATLAGDGVGTAAWVVGTTYAADAKVWRATTHRVYRSVAAGNVGNVPETTLATTPPKWVDLGPTNRWKMLRPDANYQSVATSPLVVVVAPGTRINAAWLGAIEADTVQFELRDAANAVVFTRTETMSTRKVQSWYDYFFAEFKGQSSLLLQDIPPITAGKLTVTLTAASGTVKCGALVYGTPVDLGSAALGATSGAIDFSRVVRDGFGTATLLARKVIPRTSQTTLVPKADVNKIRQTLISLRAKSAFYFGLDDAAEAYFDALSVLGIVKQWDFLIDETEFAHLTLDLEGL